MSKVLINSHGTETSQQSCSLHIWETIDIPVIRNKSESFFLSFHCIPQQFLTF